ncbi:MAG: hypothetical protein LQ344_000112 [Seirophora lacunosa]|nr:MAG: hypothetical protein LQ344_000112 [Seirophora lacunosa]
MAFRFGTSGASAFASSTANDSIQVGPELEEIQTEALGFQTIAGEAKLQLLSPPWPADELPPPTSSLLSIASRNGLLAAAGPTSVIIAGTGAVRKAFAANEADGSVKPFTPQLTLDLGIRISQVAFTADEKFLVLSAEAGGGLAVYEVQNLLQGNTKSAFEISTDKTSLRTLLPNPTPEKAELLALVTIKGELLIANLTTLQFTSGPQGIVLKDGVSSVSWSARGRQLIAGLGDGSCYQLTPEGEAKNSIPRPPDLEVEQHVSAISWLENELFLVAHTTTTEDKSMIPATTFRVVTRQLKPRLSHTFQKLPDPCPPFGMNRCPPFHFMQRLRNFPPNLSDMIVVSSTASADVGLFTRADTALSTDVEAEKITKTFTTTTMANDSRRAQLPMNKDFSDTSPIGMALDLSSTEKVPRPLPGEEMDESVGPLPSVMILNNEGLLTSWWMVYAESIRQKTTYPGLVVAGGFQQQAQTTKSPSPFATSATQGTAAPLNPNAFGNASPQPNSFVNSGSTNNAFGSTSAFGTSSALGSKPSIWNSGAPTTNPSQSSGAAFGQPAFGSPMQVGEKPGGTAFGSPGGLGSRTSPWGTPSSTTQTAGSTFGQPASLGMGAGLAFGSNTPSKPFGTGSSGGFANFAAKPGFAEAAAAAKPSGESPFAKAGGPSFGFGMNTDTAFGAASKKPGESTLGLFGSNDFSAQFKLGSTFKGDGTSSTDAPKPTAATNTSLFGGDFANRLGDAQSQPAPPVSTEANMEEGEPASDREAMSEASDGEQASATPANKPKSSLFGFQQTNPPVSGGLFGTQAQSKTTPAMVQSSMPSTFPSSHPQPVSTTPEDTPRKPEEPVRLSVETTSPTIKGEPPDESQSGISADVPGGPLPPDPTSKESYSPGETSQSSASGSKSASQNAPLPPDFTHSNAEPDGPELDFGDESALPEDNDSGLDDEGSGVDVAQEISPTTDPTRTPKITPGSSFGASLDKSPEGVFASRGQSTTLLKAAPLFGEVDKSSKLIFPQPARTQESPRSPSPIRSHLAVDGLRPDNARSISAPNAAIKSLSGRKVGPKPGNPLAEPQPSLAELQQREQERLAAQRARQAAEEQTHELNDGEDDCIAEILNAEVEPSRELAGLVVYEDYTKEKDREPGAPIQIESLYRDINSMIDTLGLNARNLESFIRGHSESCKYRSMEDLEKPDWCLGEITQLEHIEDEISGEVNHNRLSKVDTKLAECEEFKKDLKRLRDRQREISTSLVARSDEDRSEDPRYAQLPVDQAVKQKELRAAFKRIQELTAEAERKLLELRTDLAAQGRNSSSNGRSSATRKPTVEAVMNTIYKMTSMIQQRSGDIDVLEAKMRKLRIPMVMSTGGGGGGWESSPYASLAAPPPPPSEQAADSSLSKSMGGLKLSSSVNGTPQKQVVAAAAAATPEQASRYRAKVQRRKEMNALVKQVWTDRGPVVRPLD